MGNIILMGNMQTRYSVCSFRSTDTKILTLFLLFIKEGSWRVYL